MYGDSTVEKHIMMCDVGTVFQKDTGHWLTSKYPAFRSTRLPKAPELPVIVFLIVVPASFLL